jgi:ribonuclease HII
MRIPYPTFIEEQILWKSGVTHIAGVDEVGRGAFAGPVVTAAVLLRPDFPLTLGVHDSKLLKPDKRETLAEYIKQNALSYFIDEVCVDCINKEGIGKSTQKSFSNSISNLSLQPEFILVDAFYIDSIDKTIQKPIIKGDQISLSIAAASILAKVYRDHLMEKLGETYPQYSFAINKGYGTSAHRAALKEFGLTNLHRTSFSLEKYITT